MQSPQLSLMFCKVVLEEGDAWKTMDGGKVKLKDFKQESTNGQPPIKEDQAESFEPEGGLRSRIR